MIGRRVLINNYRGLTKKKEYRKRFICPKSGLEKKKMMSTSHEIYGYITKELGKIVTESGAAGGSVSRRKGLGYIVEIDHVPFEHVYLEKEFELV